MLNALARGSVSKVTDPIGRGLLRIGLSPDLVTILGTAGAVAGSILLLGTGQLLAGTIVVTVFVLFDLLDGAMARARGYGTDFGVVLDASCDRIADGALFGSLVYYCFTSGHSPSLGVAALIALVSGQVVSYVKARADSVGLKIGGAIAERAERNVLGLVGAGLAGMGVPHAFAICLWLLAAACVVTVVQRLAQTRIAYLSAPGRSRDAHRRRAGSRPDGSGDHVRRTSPAPAAAAAEEVRSADGGVAGPAGGRTDPPASGHGVSPAGTRADGPRDNRR